MNRLIAALTAVLLSAAPAWAQTPAPPRVMNAADVAAALTYVPLSAALLGQPNGPALLDSQGHLNTYVGTTANTIAAGNDARLVGALQNAQDLADLCNVILARQNLGLGTAAVMNVGTGAGTVAAGNDTRLAGALQASSNLSDLASALTARGNLGLGGAAVLNVGTTSGTVAAGTALQPGTDISSNAATALYGTLSRTLAARFADTVNAIDSSPCNGTNDDTTTLQAALNSSVGHAVFYIPPGVVCVTNELDLPANSSLQNFGTIKQLARTGANGQGTVVVKGSNVLIDMGSTGVIDGNSANVTGTLGGITNSGSGFVNILVRGGTIQNTHNWPFNITNASHSIVYGTTFGAGGSSIEFAAGGSDDWFDHVKVNGPITDLAIGFYGGISASGIINSTVSSSYSDGIFMLVDTGQPVPPRDILVSHNISTGNGGSGIVVTSNLAGQKVANAMITANDVFGNNLGGNGNGILIGGATGSKVSGNFVHGNLYHASQPADIWITSSGYDTDVTDNRVLDPQQGSTLGCAIGFTVSNHLLVANNQARDDQTTKTMANAVCGTTGAASTLLDNHEDGAINSGTDPVTYEATSSGRLWYDGVHTISTNMQERGFPAFVANAGSKTTGYTTTGVQFGYNATGGSGEGDIFVGPGGGTGGLSIYQLTNLGAVNYRLAYWDSVGNLFNRGHLTFNGTAPVVSACGGTTTPNAGSTDASGSVTEGTSATACTITFAAAFTNGHCDVSSPTGTPPTGWTDPVTTALTITNVSATGDKFVWKCN